MIHQIARQTLTLLTLFLLVSTANAENKGLSREPLSAIATDGEVIPLYTQSHALLIGVSKYTNGWSSLSSVKRELDTVQEALEGQGFNVVRVDNPDSGALYSAFEGFIADYGYDTNNRLLFYYSGHGHSDDRHGYLVPSNAPSPNDDSKGFRRSALDMNQIVTWAKKMDSKHALFLFDSCFSGTIFKSKSLPKGSDYYIEKITGMPVRQFITAGSAGETVPAKSTFTPAFVDAITKGFGDLNEDGYVTGSELGVYLSQEVPRYVDQIPQYGKIKEYDLAQGDFVFFNETTASAQQAKDKTAASNIELAYWQSAEKEGTIAAYELYIKKFPEGEFADLASLKAEQLKKHALQKEQLRITELKADASRAEADADKQHWEKMQQLGTLNSLAEYAESCSAPCQFKALSADNISKIKQYKQNYQKHLNKNALTEGPSGTALQSITAIEALIPNDKWLSKARKTVADKFADRGESELSAGDIVQAKLNLEQGLSVQETEQLKELQFQINKKISLRTQTEASSVSLPEVHIEHQVPNKELASNQPYVITATVNAPERVKQLELYYRDSGKSAYQTTELKALATPGLYMVELPESELNPPSLEYYLQLQDSLGIKVASGSKDAPLILNLVEKLPNNTGEKREPPINVSSKKWLWIGLGAVAAGVLLSSQSSDPGSDDGEITLVIPNGPQ